MAFRLATFAARRIPLYNFARSTILSPISKEANNMIIGGARNDESEWGESKSDRYTECKSADMYTERKPDFFVHHCLERRVDDLCVNFSAYSLEEDGSITMSPKYNIYPPSILLKHFSFKASCNGLFYFHGPCLGHALWNPTTSEYKILPKPYAKPPDCHTYSIEAYGMWYNHRLQDFKVVNLVHACLEDESHSLIQSTHHIDLYSLKTNSWKRIPCKGDHFLDASSQACFEGILYCATSKVILSFDISTETFSTLPLPDGWLHGRCHILEYKGLLSALVYSDDENPLDWRTGNWKYEFWIMRYGLWRRGDIVFDINKDIWNQGIVKPIRFSQDGKLMYCELWGVLVVFDCGTGMVSKHLDVSSPLISATMIPCVENFVQLNGISMVSHVLRRGECWHISAKEGHPIGKKATKSLRKTKATEPSTAAPQIEDQNIQVLVNASLQRMLLGTVTKFSETDDEGLKKIPQQMIDNLSRQLGYN